MLEVRSEHYCIKLYDNGKTIHTEHEKYKFVILYTINLINQSIWIVIIDVFENYTYIESTWGHLNREILGLNGVESLRDI